MGVILAELAEADLVATVKLVKVDEGDEIVAVQTDECGVTDEAGGIGRGLHVE